MNPILRRLGGALAKHLTKPLPQGEHAATSPPERLARTLRAGDVLLVEGNTRISVAIKYLTQSTWSHAAICVGDAVRSGPEDGEPRILVEADLRAGIRAVPLSRFAGLHTRICRPVGLTPEDLKAVIGFVISKLGQSYDLKNLVDLARYLLPTPPVPSRWRRRLIALGSGDPTRAICSTLIAQAFQHVRYPILPTHEAIDAAQPGARGVHAEILHIRHHSLFAPSDFDISPYFAIIKPNIECGFDYRELVWADEPASQFSSV